MSTDRARPAGSRPPVRRAFLLPFLVVAALLAVLGLAGAAVSTLQGPRVTAVDVDPEAAAAASGGRLIVSTSLPLAEVSADQVTITPEVPFAVDTSGRSLGVRFGLPLRDDTEYTITIEGLTAAGGGPATEVTESFRTPRAEVFLLQRGDTGAGEMVAAAALPPRARHGTGRSSSSSAPCWMPNRAWSGRSPSRSVCRAR